MTWTVELVSDEVRDELDGFPVDIRAKFERIVNLIREFGLENVREPYVKHLEGRLWEMRRKGRDCQGDLRHGPRTARGGRSGLCQEDPEDPAPGN